ncbi:Gfo/Idh/MocA family protein [Dactylosporangium sp. CS-047395]|uniref:Gfo/Idh/MocA family protein n=1 Tax=Dactylosporangium sp. CS-047395 TaxID=3239936 RepID=UPI003D8D7702
MRLGIVGAGDVAWRHAAAAAETPGLELVVVEDRDPQRAERLAGQYGARVGRAIEEAELVVLAVPHAYHLELALEALAAGRKVLVEKPMGRTVDECDRMMAAAQPGQLYVGQQGRFFGQVMAAKDELSRLGAPLLYLERRSTDYRSPGRPAWFTDQELAGGGIAMLVGVHSIDRACWLLDTRPHLVAGSVARPGGLAVETSAAAVLSMESGVQAHIVLVDSTEFFHETTVVCAGGTLIVDPQGVRVDGRRVHTVDGDREYTLSFRRQYEAILNGEPVATAEEGRTAVATVQALYRSARNQGRPTRPGAPR